MLKKVTKMWVTNCKKTIAQLRTTLNIWMNYKQLFYQLIKLAKYLDELQAVILPINQIGQIFG